MQKIYLDISHIGYGFFVAVKVDDVVFNVVEFAKLLPSDLALNILMDKDYQVYLVAAISLPIPALITFAEQFIDRYADEWLEWTENEPKQLRIDDFSHN